MPNNNFFDLFLFHILTLLVVHCVGHGKKKKKKLSKKSKLFRKLAHTFVELRQDIISKSVKIREAKINTSLA